MFNDLKESLYRWGSSTSERTKLQHSYLFITVVVVLIAGIVSLINANLGHKLTFIALAAIVIYLINAVVWNLLNSILIAKLPKNRRK